MSSIENRITELEKSMMNIGNRFTEQDPIPTLITEKSNKIDGLTNCDKFSTVMIHRTINNLDGLSRIDKLNKLNECKCCDRHQISRPKDLSIMMNTVTPIHNKSLDNCNCPCRHYARFICRNF